MDQLPSKRDVREFRAFLDANDYNEKALQAAIGTASPPHADNARRLAYVTREATPGNALIRLFLLGKSIDPSMASDTLPASFIDLCTRTGLASLEQGRMRAKVVIVGIQDLLFASNAFRVLGGAEAGDFVLPASTHSANFLRRLTLRSERGSMLDLGCGCGIHALFAARHCSQVTATDISPAAIRYTTFNSWLNDIDNVECIEGDRFEPVAGRTFDLIVSNPPFVLGPDDSFVYRDSGLELDEFCQQLIHQAPGFLNEEGYLQMLCETVEFEGEPWQERLKSWFAGTGSDAWILHSPALHPVHYVSQRAADVSGGDVDQATRFDAWIDYFEARHVAAIRPVMVAMRRREGNNWMHVHHLPGDVEQDAGEAVSKSIAACDFLERCSNDQALLTSTLMISPQVALEQRFSRLDQRWEPQSSVLRMTNALPMDAEVDMPILAFLNLIDGKTSLQFVFEKFSQTVGADTARLTSDLLPIVRLLVGRGFLEPVDQTGQHTTSL